MGLNAAPVLAQNPLDKINHILQSLKVPQPTAPKPDVANVTPGSAAGCGSAAATGAAAAGPMLGPDDLGPLRQLRKGNEEAARRQYAGRQFAGVGTVAKIDMNPLSNIADNPIYEITVDFKKNGTLICHGLVPVKGIQCAQDPTPLRPGQTLSINGTFGGIVDWGGLGNCHWDIVPASALPAPTYSRDVDLTVAYGEMLGDRSNEIQFQRKYPYGKLMRVTGLKVLGVSATEVSMGDDSSPAPKFSCRLRPSAVGDAAELKAGMELAIAGKFAKPKQIWLPWALDDCTFDRVK